MNELQRDKIQVDELRVLGETDSIKVDILAYDNPKIDYEDNELVTRAWVLSQPGVIGGNITKTTLAANGLNSYNAPIGYSVFKANVYLETGGFDQPHPEFIVGVSEFANQIQVDDQGQAGYIVWY